MKLVDILARDLKDWPSEHGVVTITQDADAMVFGWSGQQPEIDEGYWVFAERSRLSEWRPGNFQLSTDRNTAIVTRAQWQAAVDALKAGEQAWDGEGLPPVGTVCEFYAYRGGDPVWKECKVIAHDNAIAVINYKGNYSGHPHNQFRPIRTAEQIAAEERKTQILEMIDVFGLDTSIWGLDTVRDICGHLWEAGYRKQVQP